MKRTIALLFVIAAGIISGVYISDEQANKIKNNGVFFANQIVYFNEADNQTTFSRVAYGNGIYVSAPQNLRRSVWYSTNGVTWMSNAFALAAPKTPTNLCRIYCGSDGTFVAIHTYTNSYEYSTNGIDWTAGSLLDTNALWVDGVYNSNRNMWIFVADDCDQIIISTNIATAASTNQNPLGNQTNMRACAINFAGTVVIVGETNKSIWSINMTNWYTNTNFVLKAWNSIASDGTNFIAVCSATNLIAKSTTGSNWVYTNITAMPRGATYKTIRYIGNGKFVIIPASTNFIVILTNCETFGAVGASTNAMPFVGEWNDAAWSTRGLLVTGDTNWTAFSIDPLKYPFYATKQLSTQKVPCFLIKNNISDKPIFALELYATNDNASSGRAAYNIYEGLTLQGDGSNRYQLASNALWFNPTVSRTTNYYGAWYDTHSNAFQMASNGKRIYSGYVMPGSCQYFTCPVQMDINKYYMIELTNIGLSAGRPYLVKLYLYK